MSFRNLVNYFIFGAILGICLIFSFFYFGSLTNIPKIPKAFVILSGSMEPELPVGSVAVVIPRDFYIPGDIITFKPVSQKEIPVTHRITAINQSSTYFQVSSYVTKGDANKTIDPQSITDEAIIGKVFLTIPYLGYLIDFTKKPQGFIFLVIIPATIIIYEELKNLKKELINFLKSLKIMSKLSSFKFIHFSPTSLRYLIILPVAAAAFTAVLFTQAFFNDNETTTSNIFGAATSFPTPSGSPTISPTPSPQIAQVLVINEILPDASCSQGNTEAQWIEVFNGYNTTVNLKNFKITDGTNTIDLVTANSLNLPSGSFALLAHNSAIWSDCWTDNGAITGNLGGQLNIDVGTLKLLDTNDNIIDVVSWGGTTGLNPIQNQSVERNPDGLDTAIGDSFNSSDFVVRTTPMPGL